MVWLGFGRSTMMIGLSGAEHHNIYSPMETGKPTAEVNLAVQDIDAHYRQARAAGARIMTELEDAAFARRYRAVDPEQRQYGPDETSKPRHVRDVDEHYARAVENSACVVSELKDVSWGFRTYEAVDPQGNRWHVMQRVV